MTLPYDFTASQIKKNNLVPQGQNSGMIEFHIDGLRGLEGGRDILMIGMRSFLPPSGVTVNTATIAYLHGKVNFPNTVTMPSSFSCVFQDYINGRQREILNLWFDLVYNVRNGKSGLPQDYKASAHVVTWGPDHVTRGEYLMNGVWPTAAPTLPPVNYDAAGPGNLVTLSIAFSIDDVEIKRMGAYSPASADR